MERDKQVNNGIMVFYSNKNTAGKSDATGAFIPEALAFAKLHSVPMENVIGLNLIGEPTAQRRKHVIRSIENHPGGIEFLAFFGHGWASGIQFGFDLSTLSTLVEAMAKKCVPGVKVALYACLTAENEKVDNDVNNVGAGTDGGFADKMRDLMAKRGMNRGWVDAHKTAGHTTWNPYVVRFHGRAVTDKEAGGKGGEWLVRPFTPLWKKWNLELKNTKGKFRLLFPFMTENQIQMALMTGAIPTAPGDLIQFKKPIAPIYDPSAPLPTTPKGE